MKYKRKIGGDNAIQQSVKTNTVSSNSPTISESVKKSMADFKGFYNKIILFIKTNFIFSLLVAILLIIYIALFFTDTVKASDLKKEVINKKCSDFKDTCPFGKRKEDTLECEGDKCTADKCCIDDNNCSGYTGTCPSNYILTKDPKITCKSKGGSCSQKDCCKRTCDDEKSITQVDCNSDDKQYIGTEICTGDNGVCKKDDCCKSKVYCSSFTECTKDQPLIPNNKTTVCPTGKCNIDICCEKVKPKLTCSDYKGCTTSNPLISNPGDKQCLDTGCDDATCCKKS